MPDCASKTYYINNNNVIMPASDFFSQYMYIITIRLALLCHNKHAILRHVAYTMHSVRPDKI